MMTIHFEIPKRIAEQLRGAGIAPTQTANEPFFVDQYRKEQISRKRRAAWSPASAMRAGTVVIPLRGWMTISVLTVSSLAGYSELLSLLASSYSASVARFLAAFSARPVP